MTLDFDTREEFRPGHYAFLVSDAEFDAAFARIRAQGVQYYADPRRAKPGEINHLHGGRGIYFDDARGEVPERSNGAVSKWLTWRAPSSGN